MWLQAAIDNPGTSRTFSGNGLRIHYLDRPGPNADSPVVVLVHGYRAHARWWDFVAPALCRRFRVVAPDARGMGDSDVGGPYRIQDYVDDLCDFLQSGIKVLPHCVIGHSWGGYCVLRVCAEIPQIVPRAIVIDSWADVLPDEPVPKPPPIGNQRRYATPEEALVRFRLSPSQPFASAQARDYIARASLRTTPEGWGWKYDPALPSLTPEDSHVHFLPQVRAKIDVLYGERSAIISPARARALAAHLPGSPSPILIPGSHHHPMMDQPERLSGMLGTLLA